MHQNLPSTVPVLIAGGGPVGLTLSALLAKEGIGHLVIEADDGYCSGSRAICMSRRSLEILGWVGADVPLVEKGLSWAGGRSHWRDAEVLHFEMPTEPTQIMSAACDSSIRLKDVNPERIAVSILTGRPVASTAS